MDLELPKLNLKLRSGDTDIVLKPDHARWREVGDLAYLKAEEEEAIRPFTRNFRGVMPFEGAYAVQQLLAEKYSAVAINGKHREVYVPCSLSHDGIRVIWGRWKEVAIGEVRMSAEISQNTGVSFDVTVMSTLIKQDKVDAFFDRLAERLSTSLLYAGVALELPPASPDGEIDFMTPPKVMAINMRRTPEDLILAENDWLRLYKKMFQWIAMHEAFAARGDCMRGFLLAGDPGTGKSLACSIAAKMAIEKGWTVMYKKDSHGLESVLRMAAAMGNVLVIFEDIDRCFSGDRTLDTDRVLNALDGVGKKANVGFIASSNDASALPEAFIRDGRFSGKFFFELPDAYAAERLLDVHLRKRGCKPFEYEGIGQQLAGMYPASIENVVQEAYDYAVADHGPKAHPDLEDIRLAVKPIRTANQKADAIRAGHKPKRPGMDVFHHADTLVGQVATAIMDPTAAPVTLDEA